MYTLEFPKPCLQPQLSKSQNLVDTRGFSNYTESAWEKPWEKRLMIRSLGWNANLFFDGLSTYPLPKGTIAQIQIGQQPQSELTVLSLAGTGGEPFSRQ